MGTVRVPIHSRKYPNLYALIDEEDAPLVLPYRWNIFNGSKPGRIGRWYAKARATGDTFILLHRLITAAPSTMQVDHINRNPLDNRRANLRLCTMQQNQINRRSRTDATSIFRGVFFNRWKGSWQSDIQVAGKAIYLGLFDSEIDAALAYDSAARQHFGQFARINFPMDEELSVFDVVVG